MWRPFSLPYAPPVQAAPVLPFGKPPPLLVCYPPPPIFRQGVFLTKEKLQPYFDGGVKRVVVSAPVKEVKNTYIPLWTLVQGPFRQ